MIVRRLNDAGAEQFRAYLARLREESKTPPPSELIDDPRFSEMIEPMIEISRTSFHTKFEAGVYLDQTLSTISNQKLRSDVGLWSWLAVWWFDQLCPPDGNGRRNPKDSVKYIARPGDHRFGLDKHLLFFPWKMHSIHGDSSRFLLAQSLERDTREQREWTGYYHDVSTALVDLCRRLYWNESTQGFKRGARSTKQPGSLRRFVQVAKQLEVTYDLHGMTVDQLANILPAREFGRWLN